MTTGQVVMAIFVVAFGVGGFVFLCWASYNEEEIAEFFRKLSRKIRETIQRNRDKK